MRELPRGYDLASQYRIEATIGSGGFGVTYRAYDKTFERTVAIKEYFPLAFATREADGCVRPISERHSAEFSFYHDTFRAEGQALAKFNNPGIIHVHQILDANATSYLVLEFIDGLEFEAWLGSLGRRPSQRELDAILIPLLAALEDMHNAGYIHRDITPRNFMLSGSGRAPKLLDFGAARPIQSDAITAPGVVMLYSAPEMYMTKQQYQGPWTDIYALAATLYRAVAGKPPVEAPARMVKDTLEPLVRAVDASAYRPRFLRAIDWALNVRPEGRPQTIAEWQRELLPSGEPLKLQSRRNRDARKVFISYRRSDSEQIAGRIFDRLSAAFGAQNVFFDTSVIPTGVDFREHIAAAMSESAAFIAVIGPKWMRKRRWFDWRSRKGVGEDHVLTEIEMAISEAVPIVPILAGGARMPESNELPLSVRVLARANAASVRNGRDFHSDMDGVIATVAALLPDR